MIEYVDIDAPIDFTLLGGLRTTTTVREIAAHNRAVLPIADVVEVVRCKDCKYRFNYGICAYRGDNWFCGYGKRRVNN